MYVLYIYSTVNQFSSLIINPSKIRTREKYNKKRVATLLFRGFFCRHKSHRSIQPDFPLRPELTCAIDPYSFSHFSCRFLPQHIPLAALAVAPAEFAAAVCKPRRHHPKATAAVARSTHCRSCDYDGRDEVSWCRIPIPDVHLLCT